ncbi:DUF3800 domain-containing protein [Clostridium lacusfryxellense]|uniref:DUF3800 domain-containing protein n=1 Tax=Clostridium lacusfryxellense TaxID=205328 RepID=UPI001C0AC99F|nr:DUF3800 domain-containing protein [Clostridium lacusfryxellense]MBU3114036.1 DUF3800 domain-containing protein [Clostridium lacusfryxellense]
MEIEIYCDESRQDLFCNKEQINDTNRYICIGGIWIYKSIRKELKDKIKELMTKHSVYGEIKWNNVSNNKYSFYEELIDLFFSYNNEVRFRCVVVDAAKVDMELFNDNDHELGFYKFYYQLIYHWTSTNNSYSIYTDYKVNKMSNRILELRDIVNRVNRTSLVKLIQAIDSKESLLLQLEDVIMGAVGYKYNLGQKGQSPSKLGIVKRIEEYLGCEVGNTSRNESKFNVFNINLSVRGRK